MLCAIPGSLIHTPYSFPLSSKHELQPICSTCWPSGTVQVASKREPSAMSGRPEITGHSPCCLLSPPRGPWEKELSSQGCCLLSLLSVLAVVTHEWGLPQQAGWLGVLALDGAPPLVEVSEQPPLRRRERGSWLCVLVCMTECVRDSVRQKQGYAGLHWGTLRGQQGDPGTLSHSILKESASQSPQRVGPEKGACCRARGAQFQNSTRDAIEQKRNTPEKKNSLHSSM